MKNLINNFNQLLKEKLEGKEIRIDEITEIYVNMVEKEKENLINFINKKNTNIPELNNDLKNASFIIFELLKTEGYNPESYINSTKKSLNLRKKFLKV